MMKTTPINCAEAIIEVFWDPALGELETWNIVDKPDDALTVTQEWSGTNFEWDRARLVPQDIALDIEVVDDRLRLIVPKIQGHQMIELTYRDN